MPTTGSTRKRATRGVDGDEYRQELHEEAIATGGPTAEPQEPPTELPDDDGDDDEDEGAPAVQQERPASFGNADIRAQTVADPTPS